jgi:hypothetical protein
MQERPTAKKHHYNWVCIKDLVNPIPARPSTMLCNAFSISHINVPPVERVRACIERFREKGGYVCLIGFPEEREVTEFGRFQPQWLKRVARRVKREFPGGFPSDHSIYAALLEITPTAEEQEVHADGIESQPLFWTIFVPLTFHQNQGTTVFAGGAKKPPRCCRNYMFDSVVQHYGEANRSGESRWVLMLTVASNKSSWSHKVCVDI